jgi:membrane-bound lytic murein transglycosylase B
MNPMSIPRRWLAACTALVLAMPAAWAQSTDLSACMAELRPAARTGKVSDATWARHTAGLQADFSVIEKLNFQPEFRTAIWDYMSALVDEERVADGAARLATPSSCPAPLSAWRWTLMVTAAPT